MFLNYCVLLSFNYNVLSNNSIINYNNSVVIKIMNSFKQMHTHQKKGKTVKMTQFLQICSETRHLNLQGIKYKWFKGTAK